MAGRIVLFGATGYTGQLTAAALVGLGVEPVLAARDAHRLAVLRAELGTNLPVETADASEPASVARLVGRGDVLVTTVGPFLRVGRPVIAAAADAGATYLDSTGEPAFLRQVWHEFGPRARAAGAALIPAFGYDFVPGHLAAAVALTDAAHHGDATGVRVGYFVRGRGAGGGRSGGTASSTGGVLLERGYVFRAGRLMPDRPAARVHTFRLDGRTRSAFSLAGSEHLFLPRAFPGLRDVDVYLGWVGSRSRLVQFGSALISVAGLVPGVRGATYAALRQLFPGSSGGPSADQRRTARSLVVAESVDSRGGVLARAVLEGPGPYDLTAALLAQGARRAADGEVRGTGALGPLDAFGLEALSALAAEIGLTRRAEGNGSIRGVGGP